MSNTTERANLATFITHEAEAIRAKDARLRGPQRLDAVAKWLRGGKLPEDIPGTLAYLEGQFGWASDTGRPATAAVYRQVITLLWPHRKDNR